MYIPEVVPTNVTEMMAFLQPSISDGIFDSLSFDDDEDPHEIECYKGGNLILTIDDFYPSSFNFIVYTGEPNSNNGRTQSIAVTIDVTNTNPTFLCMMRCKGGIGFIYRNTNNDRKYVVIIGKTSNGKTGIIVPSNGYLGYNSYDIIPTVKHDNSSPICNRYCSIVYGDDTTLHMWGRGFTIAEDACAADRTILTPIQVVGRALSNAQFSTVFARTVMRYRYNGAQIINGKHYGCIFDFCILDE